MGSCLLLIAVIGSGIAAARLSPGDTGLELLENAAATGAALVAIILAVGAVSGAHLNPAVSLADAILGGLRRRELPVYITAQLIGAISGAILANLMFGLQAVSISGHARGGMGTVLAEVIATAGLLLVIFGTLRAGRGAAVAAAVGAYIGGAYFFTASTSFANPAVTVARIFSDTFAGIAPGSVAPFIAAQLAGTAVAVGLIRLLHPAVPAAEALLAHDDSGEASS